MPSCNPSIAFKSSLGAIALLLLSAGCAILNDNSKIQAFQVQSLFSSSITDFTVKVFYENSATPYTGAIGISGNDTWDITQKSYEALFSHQPRSVHVPHLISEMTLIPSQNRSVWSQAELTSLGNSIAPALRTDSTGTITIILLSGKYNNDSNVLGVHFSGSSFAFVFKDVVLSTGGNSISQKYIEQATVVHELGHVVGLVNNGLPMAVNHEDISHPHHSTDNSCVMYWQVENPSDILSLLTNAIGANKLNLFGPESLNDAQSYHP